MFIYLYVLQNSRTRLCAKQATMPCKKTADRIEAIWKAEWALVNRRVEN